MNWNDLKSVWRRQEGHRLSGADHDSIRQSFEAKHRKMIRALFWRDLREAVVGLGLAVFFSLTAWQLGRSYWPIGLAVVLILAVTGFFIAERIRVYRNRLGAEASVLAKVEASIADLRWQRRLLLNIALWYIAPIFLAWVIVLITSIVNAPAHAAHHLVILVCYVALAVPLMTWGVWALNRWAVRKKIEPRLEELERLHRELCGQ